MGERIRRRRLMLAITHEEAAEHSGVNAWPVQTWKAEQREPAIRFIPALVRFLGYGPEPVDHGKLPGRIVAKRRELGLPDRPRHQDWLGAWGEERAGDPEEGGGGAPSVPRHSFRNLLKIAADDDAEQCFPWTLRRASEVETG